MVNGGNVRNSYRKKSLEKKDPTNKNMETNNLKSKKGDNGKYGYVDESGNWAVEPKFDNADEFERGVARVQLNWMWGFLKEDGSWLFEPVLHEANPFSGEIACVKKGLRYGFLDRQGEWFIEPNLLAAVPSGNKEYFGVKNMDSLRAIISNQGKWITDFELKERPDFWDYGIKVDKDSKYGFLDYTGNWIISPKYKEMYEANEGRIFASLEGNDHFRLIDLSGNNITETEFYLAFLEKKFNN